LKKMVDVYLQGQHEAALADHKVSEGRGKK
jgi:hypothetical protein